MKLSRIALVASVCLVVASAASAMHFQAGPLPTPDPNATPQRVAMPATACVNDMAGIYPCHKVDLLYFMPLSDLECGSAAVVWGWTDPSTQKEYALLACNTGVSFVDISIPASPLYLGRLPTHSVNSLWRDVKVYTHYAFVGSEASGHGLQVFDLERLRSVPSPPVVFTEDAYYNNFTRSHTIAINQQTGFLYAAGSQEGSQTCGGDLHVVNIQNPLAPTFAGCLGLNGYVHEAQCVIYTGPDIAHQGKEICFNSDGRFDDSDTLAIDDVTNKNAPVQLSRVSYPNVGYTHQSWITEDQQYLLLDDEFDEQNTGSHTRTLIWNIADLDNPVLMGYFFGSTTAIDHNQYIRGSYSFQADYRAGLRIIDLKNISSASLSEYGYFDIYPSDDGAAYNGAWGNYPYFPSGNVVVSGIEEGLFILKPQFLPKLSVNDISITEGNSGTTLATFTVTLSAANTQTVVVNYATSDGSATAPSDYYSASGTLVFAPGQTTKTKTVGVRGDLVNEPDETFFFNLSSATNATIEDGQGMCTIINDDFPVPQIAISDVAVNEGDFGTSTVNVSLSLVPASAQTVTVDYATADGTAQAGSDYVATSGTVSFAPGESSKTVGVTVNGDLIIEPNETFLVNLSNSSHAVITRAQAVVTIINDDNLAVSGVSPTSGSSSGGTSVTLTGTRFSPGVAVHFGDAEATNIVVLGDTQLTATTPAMPPATLVPIHAHFGAAAPASKHPAAITFFSDFLDVPVSYPFHNFIETIFRGGITAGCGGGNDCPDMSVSRAQMAVFLLRSKYGSAYSPPPATGIFADVAPTDPLADWIERIYGEGITSGCSASPLRYCPTAPVTRGQMSVLLLKTREGTSYQPPAATGVFADVPVGHVFAAWIEELARRNITTGCGGGNYCPADATTRGQMSAFLVRTFGLQ